MVAFGRARWIAIGAVVLAASLAACGSSGGGGVNPSPAPTSTPTPNPTPTPTPTPNPTPTPGVPASFTISGLPSGTAGTAFTTPIAFAVTVKNATGNTIAGTYGNPVTLTDSDASGATTIVTSGSDSPPAGELLSSTDTATLNYTGLAIVPATVSAQATGATTGTATFAPTLSPIVYTGPTNASGNAQMNFNSSGTASTFTFNASEVGWTSAPYSKALTLTPPAGCSRILNSSTSTLSGTSFTENVAASPAAGTCTATLTDGAGQSLTNGITFTYTTIGIGVQ